MGLRENILRKKDRIMDFSLKKIRKTNKGNFEVYNNGPIVEYDGNVIGSVFDILCAVNKHNPTRKVLTEYFINRGLPTTEGIYVVDNGTRSSVITTSNIASSVAKVILDGYQADGQSDGLAKRVALAQKIIFTLRSTKNSYYSAAKLAGTLDNLKPDKCLSDTKGFYRNYPGYKAGLLEAGNINTYLIEDCLDQHIRPEFLKEKDIKFWREKGYPTNAVMKSPVFVEEKRRLLDQSLVEV